MRLADLDAEFIRYNVDDEEHDIMKRVDSMDEADGIMFLCPKCFTANGGKVGTHRVICNRPRVPQLDKRVGPGRWEFAGVSMNDLTLFGGSSSIQLRGECAAHFFVEHGSIRMA